MTVATDPLRCVLTGRLFSLQIPA